MYDLIIIGGGPAGLTATIYALRKRLNVLLITKDLGGKTNYRLQLPSVDYHLVINGEEVVNRFVNEIAYLDFTRVMDGVDRIELEPRPEGSQEVAYSVITHGGTRFTTRAIIIATGARPLRLEVPGEREFLMRGMCYSAVSYAPLFIDKSAVVIGEGGLALRAAAELARIARMVTLVAPAHGDLGSPLGQKLRKLPNVTILEGFEAERVNGINYAHSLTIRRDSDVRELFADGFFVELGIQPNSALVADLAVRDDIGRIMIDSRNRTSAPGIFAAGDVTNAYAEQVLIAIGEGTKAALSAYEYLLPLSTLQEHLVAEEWR
jgi:thioredoxin reductase